MAKSDNTIERIARMEQRQEDMDKKLDNLDHKFEVLRGEIKMAVDAFNTNLQYKADKEEVSQLRQWLVGGILIAILIGLIARYLE